MILVLQGFWFQISQMKLTETFKISFVRKAATFVYKMAPVGRVIDIWKYILSATMTSKVWAFINKTGSTFYRLDMAIAYFGMVRFCAPLTPYWYRFHLFCSASFDMLGLAWNWKATLDYFHTCRKSHCLLPHSGAFLSIVGRGGMSYCSQT